MNPRTAIYALILSAVFVPMYAHAQWAAPTATPPSNNASTPINVGSTAQVKAGGLSAGSFYTDGGSTVMGNLGVGISSPSYKLQANGDIYANGGWLRVSGTSGLYFESYGGGWHMSDSTWIRSYNSKPVYMSAGFDTGSPSGVGCTGGLGGGYTFRVCGSANASSAFYSPAFYYSSDARLKKDISHLEGSLSRIMRLEGVSFEWKDEKSGKGTNVGLIAQDVEKVYPELVATDKETGLKSVEYGNFVAPLIEAIKEQQAQIDALKDEIKALRADD